MVGKLEAVARPGKTERFETAARLEKDRRLEAVEKPRKTGKLETVEETGEDQRPEDVERLNFE